ncbi:MAG: hypothetical protein K0Q48_682 [Bacillota bacterium]|jgi:hypothetical protein|nr:hypothetical protein [Bacillota bacterium]
MGVLDFLKTSEYKTEILDLKKQLHDMQEKWDKLTLSEKDTKQQLHELQSKCNSLGVTEYYETKSKLDTLTEEIDQLLKQQEDLSASIVERSDKDQRLSKNIESQARKLSKIKELYRSVEYSIDNYMTQDFSSELYKIPKNDLDQIETISPSIILKLHSMDIQSLRKAFKENDKTIENLLQKYSDRYTTKANKTIYQLMVIALRAELQNILFNLKYEKLEKAISDVKSVTTKYLKIAADGNQSIAGTLTKFIGEVEYLFINAIKIEYNYYVKKEQARQEQLALREQMRQEAEERKALEAEKKKVEREEEKYHNEIAKIQEIMAVAKDSEIASLNARILDLQLKLSEVVLKKEEITNLQNGKAGTVYIISNLGSFGEKMFKIGMTRRLEPQDRVNELGDASVPFKFDVHSFIFSEDAVGLESTLHKKLNDARVNKVNLRKEFFYTTVDELETLVNEIDSTAEFNKTMLAEEYNQSLSSDTAYTSDFTLVDGEDSDDEE